MVAANNKKSGRKAMGKALDREKPGKLMEELLDLGVRYELETYTTLLRARAGYVPTAGIFTTDDEEPVQDSAQKIRYMLERKMYMYACASLMVTYGFTVDAILKIYTSGASKHGRTSWKKVKAEVFLGSALRHLRPGNNDEDGGAPHLVHCCWNLIALRYLEKQGIVPEDI